MKLQWCMLLWLAMVLMPAAARADEAEERLHKYSFCMVCHGYQGQGNTTVLAPALAGIEPWYLKAALAAYRAGTRHTSPTANEMQTAARMITPDEEAEAYAFIASLKPASIASVPVDAAQIRRGADGYARHCAACHGSAAEGNEQLAAPGLKRLNDWYLLSAWNAYLSGNRGNDTASATAQQMRQFAQALPADVAVEDLIAFIIQR